MLATKEPSKEKEVKETKPAAEVKETKPEVKGKKKDDFAVRHLTEAEHQELMGDTEAPEGYANKAPVVEEEKPAEETKPEAKKAEKVEEKPAEGKKDFFERLETEIVKPEGKEDLADFTPREKAYFYSMRRDRKQRQQAEEELDKLKFQEAKKKLEPKEEKPEEDEVTKFFKDRDPEDYLTVKEVQDLLNKSKEKPAKKEEPKPADDSLRMMQMNYLKLSEETARPGRDDFDAVMELAPELIGKDQKVQNEVAERTLKGENPAVVMYELIKAHKDFDVLLPAAEVRAKARKEAAEKQVTSGKPSSPAPAPEDKAKEEKAKQAEKALEDNTSRTKTTAHVSSQESKPSEERSFEEYAQMSDLEFARLPKAERARILKKLG